MFSYVTPYFIGMFNLITQRKEQKSDFAQALIIKTVYVLMVKQIVQRGDIV
jgi:hypothetical protein